MGSMLCCQADATRVSLMEMKRRLEGATQRVLRDPGVLVTIDELVVCDGCAITFSPSKFTLKGLHLHTTVKVRGGPAEIAKLAALTDLEMAPIWQDDKATAMFATSQAGAVGGSSMASFALATLTRRLEGATDKAKDLVTRTHSVRLSCIASMVKEFGGDEVTVSVKSITSDHGLLEGVMHLDCAKQILERAISQQASGAAARISQQASEAAARIADEELDAKQSPAQKQLDLQERKQPAQQEQKEPDQHEEERDPLWSHRTRKRMLQSAVVGYWSLLASSAPRHNSGCRRPQQKPGL